MSLGARIIVIGSSISFEAKSLFGWRETRWSEVRNFSGREALGKRSWIAADVAGALNVFRDRQESFTTTIARGH